MKSKLFIAGLLVVGFAGTALADSYYITSDPSTRHCTITTERPTDRMVVQQIGPLAFTSREEAEGRIRTTKVCEEGAMEAPARDSESTTTIIKRD